MVVAGKCLGELSEWVAALKSLLSMGMLCLRALTKVAVMVILVETLMKWDWTFPDEEVGVPGQLFTAADSVGEC